MISTGQQLWCIVTSLREGVQFQLTDRPHFFCFVYTLPLCRRLHTHMRKWSVLLILTYSSSLVKRWRNGLTRRAVPSTHATFVFLGTGMKDVITTNMLKKKKRQINNLKWCSIDWNWKSKIEWLLNHKPRICRWCKRRAFQEHKASHRAPDQTTSWRSTIQTGL